MGRISIGERRGLKGRGIKWGRAAIEAAEIAQYNYRSVHNFKGGSAIGSED